MPLSFFLVMIRTMEKLVMIRTMKKPALQKKLLFVIFFLFLIPLSSFADSLGEERTFFLDSSFDAEGRDNLLAVLERENEHLYFYIDSEWWRDLSAKERSEINSALDTLGDVFNSQIYPTLVGTFGSEWKPGIDGDNKITVLLHPMRKGIKGYFRIADEYFKFQVPRSNEREMVYLSSDYITDSRMKSYLAHEFQHLITFNQKERKYGFTLTGPHIDDFIFSINNNNINMYSSEGQKRSLLLNYKQAQLLDYNDNYGYYPILLFDDMGSELDSYRKTNIFNRILNNSGQVFITTMDIPEINKDKTTIFEVVDGHFSEFISN